MKIILFDVEQNEIETYRQLLADASEVDCHTEPLNEETIAMATDAEVISVFVTSKITEGMLSKLPSLKYIVCRSTGSVSYTHLDVYKRQGIHTQNAITGDYSLPCPSALYFENGKLIGPINCILTGCLLYTSRCV